MKIRLAVLLAATLAAALATAGCYSPEGGMYPRTGGATTYYSYETRPVSIRLVDLRDDTVLFAMDVPAGKQLTYDFVPDRGDDPSLRPDLMRYEVFPMGKKTGSLSNSITVPAGNSRRMDVYYRDKAEYLDAPVTEETIRTDEAEDRPGWWSPEGGRQPKDRKGLSNYDG